MKKLKRILKYFFLVTFSMLIIGIIGGYFYFQNSFFKDRINYLEFKSDFKSFKFEWIEETLGDSIELQSAMYIPVNINGIDKKLYMQFDTGSPFSIFYGTSLNSIKSQDFKYQVSTIDEKSYLTNFDFKIGENKIFAKQIRLMDYGEKIDLKDSMKIQAIGTIGTDIMDEKITIIDFKNQTIGFLKERPENLSQTKFEKFDFKGRRIFFPANIDGKETTVFYDSGTSAFGLITTKKLYENYKSESNQETCINANSWGDELFICSNKSNKSIIIGNSDLKLKKVSYVNKYPALQSIPQWFTDFNGWIGNKIFTENVLIIDTEKQEFLVL